MRLADAEITAGTNMQRKPGDGRGQLRLMTCGSVDDGKSTLVGRLLFDSGVVHDDHLASLAAESRRYGTAGAEVDYALLLDGLESEREQGITIDVAYRFFATARRSFVIADTPGHEQYTRNMATAASLSQLAVILVDARKGLLPQTRRHTLICALLGIRHIVLAVNKMDLVEFSGRVFADIVKEYRQFAARFDFTSLVPIPVSARHGDNVIARSARLGWYHGPSLLGHLETVEVGSDEAQKPFRFPVQWVNRPDPDFRGLSGEVVSGAVETGAEIAIQPAGTLSRIERILGPHGETDRAAAGDAVTLVLADEVDAARGDIIVARSARAEVGDQFSVNLIWMSQKPLLPGRSYLMRSGARWVPASVTALKYIVDIHSGEHLAAKSLALNEIAVCNLSTAAPIAFDPYVDNRRTGSFILVDRDSHETVAAGMIRFGLRRAQNIHWERLALDKPTRAAQKQQTPRLLWFTGLSGSGKSTIARLVEQRLHLLGCHTYMLDGDNIRHGLNRDLGFTDTDRVENIRRIGEVARLMLDAGLIVVAAFISPFRAERQMVREMLADDEFVEIFVDTPLEECIRRDPKGLYAKAAAGQLKNFTGLDSPYEAPLDPEFRLDTLGFTPEELASSLVARFFPDRIAG